MKRRFSKQVVARYLQRNFPEEHVFRKGLGWDRAKALDLVGVESKAYPNLKKP